MLHNVWQVLSLHSNICFLSFQRSFEIGLEAMNSDFAVVSATHCASKAEGTTRGRASCVLFERHRLCYLYVVSLRRCFPLKWQLTLSTPSPGLRQSHDYSKFWQLVLMRSDAKWQYHQLACKHEVWRQTSAGCESHARRYPLQVTAIERFVQICNKQESSTTLCTFCKKPKRDL